MIDYKKLKASEPFKYTVYLVLFLAFSFGLSTFRGSDHGMAPALNASKFADGRHVPGGLLKDKSAVIYYWATWCTVCNTNLPLVKWYASLLNGPETTVFLTVEEGADHSELANYISENEVEFPVIIGDERMLSDWKISGFPTFYFIDKTGKIRYVDTGFVNPLSLGIRILFLKLL